MKGGRELPDTVAGTYRNHWPSTYRIGWLIWPEYAVKLNAMTAKMEFGTIYDEILKHFAKLPDARIEVTLDISAHSDHGFDEVLQRIIRENIRQLKFLNGEFEEE